MNVLIKQFMGVWLLVLLFTLPNLALGKDFSSSPKNVNGPKHFLFHVKTSLDEDDAQICVAPNVAWAALQKGHAVTLLFDGSAVTSVKKGSWFNADQTGMDKAKLPEREREALAEQFNHPLDQVPHNYGEYLGFLKSKGAKLYINRTMMRLYKIDPKIIDSNLEPITLPKMIELMEEADVYMVY